MYGHTLGVTPAQEVRPRVQKKARPRYRATRPPLNRTNFPVTMQPLGYHNDLAMFEWLGELAQGVVDAGSAAVDMAGNLWDQASTAVSNMWDKIDVQVDPLKALQAANKLLPAGAVTSAVKLLNQSGVTPTVRTPAGVVPITPATIQAAQAAASGRTFIQDVATSNMTPWLIGGGVLLLVLATRK